MSSPPNSDFPSLRPRLRPPPDYTKRKIKLRIFTLLACMFLVAALAERASKPETWNWLWQMETRTEDAKVQNRLNPTPRRTEHDPPGTFVASADAQEVPPPPELDEESKEAQEPVERAWEQGWKEVLYTLSADDRDQVFRWLYAVRSGEGLPEDERGESEALLADIDKAWNDYHARAFQSIAMMTPDERVLWVDVLRQVNTRWSSEVKPALEAVVAGGKLDAKQTAAIKQYDATLRDLALRQVRDDTVFRSAEHDIWFYLLSEAQEHRRDAGSPPSEGVYVQLFKQPENYRGQLVQMKGVARMGYRIDAPPNYLGIKEYYVLTLQPENRPDSPVIVYALSVPEGFPEIAHRDNDRTTTELHEDMVIDGIFYKRLAYQAVGGTYTAPMLITREPRWIPEMPTAPYGGRGEMTWANIGTIVAVAGAAALVAIGLILWRLRKDTEQSLAKEMNHPAESPQFDGLDVTPSPRDALAALAERERNSDSAESAEAADFDETNNPLSQESDPK